MQSDTGGLYNASLTSLDTDWQVEIVRRAQGIQSGEVKTIPWSEVRKKGRILLESWVERSQFTCR